MVLIHVGTGGKYMYVLLFSGNWELGMRDEFDLGKKGAESVSKQLIPRPSGSQWPQIQNKFKYTYIHVCAYSRFSDLVIWRILWVLCARSLQTSHHVTSGRSGNNHSRISGLELHVVSMVFLYRR